jgi:TRAP-type C4-dicarboxylate transport system substrate-binding protein
LLFDRSHLEQLLVLGQCARLEQASKDIQGVIAKHVNAAGINERADLAALNTELQNQLSQKGLTFNKVDTTPFRAALQKAGFYAEWNKKYGKESWAVLEKYTGTLA